MQPLARARAHLLLLVLLLLVLPVPALVLLLLPLALLLPPLLALADAERSLLDPSPSRLCSAKLTALCPAEGAGDAGTWLSDADGSRAWLGDGCRARGRPTLPVLLRVGGAPAAACAAGCFPLVPWGGPFFCRRGSSADDRHWPIAGPGGTPQAVWRGWGGCVGRARDTG